MLILISFINIYVYGNRQFISKQFKLLFSNISEEFIYIYDLTTVYHNHCLSLTFFKSRPYFFNFIYSKAEYLSELSNHKYINFE